MLKKDSISSYVLLMQYWVSNINFLHDNAEEELPQRRDGPHRNPSAESVHFRRGGKINTQIL